MAPSSMSIFEVIQQILRPSIEFPLYLSDFEKERILEVYAAGIDDQVTIDQVAQQGLLHENQQAQFFPATAFSLLKIFDSLNDGVLLLDQNGFVRYINKSFERIAQAKKQVLIGRPLLETRPGARLFEVVKEKKALLGQKRIFKDIQYITDMYPIMVNHRCIGGVTIARDITEIKTLQTKLRDYHSRYSDLLEKIQPKNTAIYQFSDILGNSFGLRNAKKLAQKLAPSNLNILIRGTSGTGKELFAHSIHSASQVSQNSFITVNCAAIPALLLESELFGYVKGAFTGADPNGKKGLIALADGGTLFLDEIGDMDIQLQAKLLRVLQTGEYQPLGSTKTLQAQFRLIAATNRNLEELIQKGLFREDLFYRLNVSTIELPALQDSSEDIIELAQFFLNRHPGPWGKFTLSEDIKQIFREYPWPGNIRELENTIRFTTTIAESSLITKELLPSIFLQYQSEYPISISSTSRQLKELQYYSEKELLKETLQQFESTVKGKKEVAKHLGISLTTLYDKIKKYDLPTK